MLSRLYSPIDRTHMKVSVIIPVYNVERFIGRCVQSLMMQTLQDVEFIFIDDASPDKSMEIVREITSGFERNVLFLKHTRNRGLPAARNTGLKAASGEYIYHCDSDDWLEPTMLEKMTKAAFENNADFVYCDFFLSFATREQYMTQPEYCDKFDTLQRGLMTGRLKHNVWNKLIKRSLYLDFGISSPEEHSKGGEDYMVFKLLRMAEVVVHVQEPLYHYNRTNINAITKTNSEAHFEDIKANADDVITFLTTHPITNPEYLQFFKLDVKLPFLMDRSREQYERWLSWYPEANASIWNNPEVNLRTKVVEWLAKMGFFPIVWLYATVIDIMYKLRFRK